ncbi:MAG: hypothetical protein E7666_05390 [Ruminococcaceae bacterium]|nr:hypothetical protein [Oscillospiraceae bacterium]
MHLVLPPDVFALRLNTAIFDCFAVENRKFRATKKPTVGFFEQRLRQWRSLFSVFPRQLKYWVEII